MGFSCCGFYIRAPDSMYLIRKILDTVQRLGRDPKPAPFLPLLGFFLPPYFFLFLQTSELLIPTPTFSSSLINVSRKGPSQIT